MALMLRQLQQQTEDSFLGWIWLLLGPLVQLGIYTIVFGVFFDGRFGIIEGETPWHYALGIFIGMMLVQTITEPLQLGPVLLTSQSNLVKKNAFPLFTLPLAQTMASFARLGLTLSLWSVGVLIIAPAQALSLLLLPVIVFPLFLIALGLNAGISALSVYFGDIGQAVRMLGQVVFWSSGIFYSRQEVEAYPMVWAFLKWNPVLHVIEESRRVLLWGVSLDFSFYAYSLVFGLVGCAVGMAIFDWLKSGFADFV